METISLNKSGSKKVIFGQDFVEYRGKKIFFKDVEWIRYEKREIHYHVIPLGVIFGCTIASKKTKIGVGISSVFYVGFKSKNLIFSQLLGLCAKKIEPILIEKYFQQISLAVNEPVRVANLFLSPQGFAVKKLFRAPAVKPWSQFRGSSIKEGKLYLFEQNEKGQEKNFAIIPFSLKNATLLSSLLNQCAQKFK